MSGVLAAVELTIGEAMLVLVVVVALACSAAVLLVEWSDVLADTRRRATERSERNKERSCRDRF